MSYVVAFWPEGLCDNGPDADWAACYERLKGTQRGPAGPVVGAFPAEVTAELPEMAERYHMVFFDPGSGMRVLGWTRLAFWPSRAGRLMEGRGEYGRMVCRGEDHFCAET